MSIFVILLREKGGAAATPLKGKETRNAPRSMPVFITDWMARKESRGLVRLLHRWQTPNARLITLRIILVQRPDAAARTAVNVEDVNPTLVGLEVRALSETDNPVKPGWECSAGLTPG